MTQPVVVQGTPVVVQGTPVGSPYAASAYEVSTNPVVTQQQQQGPSGGNRGPVVRGEKQATRCRDPIFALLFYVAIIAVVAVAATYGQTAFNEAADNTNAYEYEGYIYAIVICALISFVVSGLGMAFMFKFPSICIKAALIFSVVLTGLWMVFGFMSGNFFIGVLGIFFFMMSVCYAWLVWSRIPFATVNLVTAITAVKSNCGLALVAYFFTLVAAAFTFIWAVAFMGVWDQSYNCQTNQNNGAVQCGDPNYGLLFLIFIPFFFAHQVFQACIHVTVAGTVGTWWFEPQEGKGFCSSAVRDSFCRTITTSFGSICFGSLLVAILQALKMLANQARNSDDCSIFACIAECILDCLASLLEYFNKWAYIYVGLYGYGYLEAGKNVMTLFQNRGWEAIIADDLTSNALFMISVVCGGIVGIIGIVISVTTTWFDDDFNNVPGNTTGIAFIFGFIVGLVLCSIFMSTIGSAVNTVLVLFAEAPAEFQANYPELSHKMREVWSQVYPGSI